MRVPSIQKIKKKTQEKSPYFFSPATLDFFGQTMSSFTIERSPKGRLFIYAPFSDRGKVIGYSFREVKTRLIGNWELKVPQIAIPRTLETIQDYIAKN